MLALPAPGFAQSAPAWSMRWDAPPGCPNAAAVRARVATLVGAEARRDARVSWAVSVRRDGGGYLAAVRAHNDGQPSTQTLSAPRCEELAETAALLLAWTIQPDGLPPAPPPAPAPAPPPPPPRSTPLRWRVGAGLRLDVGMMPGVALGPGLTADVGGPHASLSLDLAWLPTQEGPFDPRRGGRFEAWTAALSGCARWSVRRWTAGPCAGLEAGALRAEGYGVSNPARAWEPWIAARTGGFVELAIAGPLRVVVRLAARIPLRRAAFVLEGVGAVHQPSALGLVADLGAVAHF
ncbi:MAG: hypothetical protein U0325_16700 [Polyangiales bacterium]